MARAIHFTFIVVFGAGILLTGTSCEESEQYSDDEAAKAVAEIFEKAEEADPSLSMWYTSGSGALKAGRYDDALSWFDKGVAERPDWGPAWNGKAFALEGLGRYDEALQCYDRAIQLNPNMAELWLQKSLVFSRLQQWDNALASAERAIELKPGLGAAWVNKGSAQLMLSRAQEAQASYERAIELLPDSGDAWRGKGMVLLTVGQSEEAITCLDRAVALNANDVDSWFFKSRALLALGRYEAALPCIERVLQLAPNHAFSWYLKGLALQLLGRDSEAKTALEKAVQLGSSEAKKILEGDLESLGGGDAAGAGEAADRAEAEEVIRDLPKEGETWDEYKKRRHPDEPSTEEEMKAIEEIQAAIKRVQAEQEGKASAKAQEGDAAAASATMTNSVGMKLVWIPPGEFMMGSPSSEPSRDDDEGPVHKVTITRGFWMGQYEVTQGQCRSMGIRIPDRSMKLGFPTLYWKGENFPVEGVGWHSATALCEKLSTKEGRTYRLPTEAEWEYACGGGSTSAYYYGEDAEKLSDYAWFIGSDERSANVHPVGEKLPNRWGLYDMAGNVSEWCQDWYSEDYYAISPTRDPNGPLSGKFRVMRGGDWWSKADFCRSASRSWADPAYAGGRPDTETPVGYGFRVVLEAD